MLVSIIHLMALIKLLMVRRVDLTNDKFCSSKFISLLYHRLVPNFLRV
jgi:hypothetical protein